MSLTWVILGIIGVIILWVIVIFNSLVTSKNRVSEAWSDIDVQLKRRYDLIPNLVETVKGYAAHEKEVFQKVTEARTKAISAGTVKEQGEAENMLTGALKSIFAVAENYPELKANENFLSLQIELADTENKIQAARRFYNGNVRDYNIKIEKFPNNLVGGALNFKHRDLFELEEAEKEEVKKTPEVKFGQ
jgi:LemA protein